METAIVVPDNARWYVLHTYSGHEQKVAAAIKQRVEAMKIVGRVFDVIVPTRDTIVVKRGKKRSKNFPGYILIQMILDDDSWLVVRTTPALFFVGVGNRPTPLPKLTHHQMPNFPPKFNSYKGEAVKIVDGPFADFKRLMQ